MSEHIPSEITYDAGHAVDCSCGERGALYSTPVGARLAYAEHVVQQVTADAGWAETYTVEVDWSYAGDAS